jgi:hypothetical protein
VVAVLVGQDRAGNLALVEEGGHTRGCATELSAGALLLYNSAAAGGRAGAAPSQRLSTRCSGGGPGAPLS